MAVALRVGERRRRVIRGSALRRVAQRIFDVARRNTNSVFRQMRHAALKINFYVSKNLGSKQFQHSFCWVATEEV